MAKAATTKVRQRLLTQLTVDDVWYRGFSEPETITDAVSRLDWLWWLVSASERRIDCRNFFNDNDTARYLVVEPNDPDRPVDISDGRHGDARIAVSNWRFALDQWEKISAEPCWDAVKVYPSAKIVAAVAQAEFGIGTTPGSFVTQEPSDAKVIKTLELIRTRGVVVMKPIFALFQAALTVEGHWKPREVMQRPSQWIGATQMENLMTMNRCGGLSEKSIQRKKKAWGAMYQGTNTQIFRFDLDHLDNMGITYPASLDPNRDRD